MPVQYKDEECWLQQKEHTKTTLESVSLEHLIDPNHDPTNLELDKAQTKWLCKIFVDVVQNPQAKTIVVEHADQKNTRTLCGKISVRSLITP